MRALAALILKDFKLEFRLKDAISSILFLSLVLSIVVTSGMQRALLDPQVVQRLFPTLLWLVFIFAATVSLGRTAEHDLENHAYEGVILTGIPLSTVFVAKLFSNSIFILLGQLCTLLILPVLCGVSITKVWFELGLLTLCVTFAYAALATLLSAISSASKMRGLLLPIILLPLIFPLFFCAVELSSDLILDGKIMYDSFWASLLLALDVVYFTLGFNLYPYVLKE